MPHIFLSTLHYIFVFLPFILPSSLIHPPFFHLLVTTTIHPFLPSLLFFSDSHPFPPVILSLFYLFFPPLQPCVAVLRGTLCCPQPLSAVLRVLLLWLRLFLSSSTTTTLYYPPLPTSWQVHTLCTTCLPACLETLLVCTSVRN